MMNSSSESQTPPAEPKSTPKPSPPGGGGGPHFPNPRESINPDAATLRDQWRFAIKQYSRWYSHAWGTAILAGVSFFALGWVIKGSNPLPSLDSNRRNNKDTGGGGADDDDERKPDVRAHP